MQVEIIKFLQGFSSPFLDKLFEYITITAEESAIIVIAAIVLWCISKEIGYRMGFICLSGTALNAAIKEIFHTPRPIGHEGIKSLRTETAGGYSFPSGHTQGATTLWFTLMINFKNKILYILGTIIVLLVGISRMYLGVHWPIDVVGGIVIGVIWVLLVNKLFDYSKKINNKLLLLILFVPLFIGMIIFSYDVNYIKVCAAMTGLFLGYVIEDKYIHYQEKAGLLVQILKVIIGLGILLGIKSGLKVILPESSISDFIRYTIIGLWVPAGATFLFSKLFRSKAAIQTKATYKA